jgi:hypothetical protein
MKPSRRQQRFDRARGEDWLRTLATHHPEAAHVIRELDKVLKQKQAVSRGEPKMIDSEKHFPPGEYYLGDLCYVLGQDQGTWDQICDALFAAYDRGEHATTLFLHETPVWLARTAYGDGVYYDAHGRGYAVDSGTIGLCPTSLCTATALAELDDTLGQVITMAHDFHPTWDHGVFSIGTVTIDTRGETTEEGERQ